MSSIWPLLVLFAQLIENGPVLSYETVPGEVLPFIDHENRAIFIKRVDLNGDHRDDYLLIFQQAAGEKDEIQGSDRPLVILTREKNGQLAVAARSDKLVLCESCGGVRGDPFVDIDVAPNSFTVRLAGGSSWLWREQFSFRYERGSHQWFLSEVITHLAHVGGDPKEHSEIYRPSDFGRIELSHFNHDAWQQLFARNTIP